MSALRRVTDSGRTSRHVRKVPVASLCTAEKTARRGGPIKWSQTCRLRRDILPHIAAGMIQLASRQMAIDIRRREFVGGLGGVVFRLARRGKRPAADSDEVARV